MRLITKLIGGAVLVGAAFFGMTTLLSVGQSASANFANDRISDIAGSYGNLVGGYYEEQIDALASLDGLLDEKDAAQMKEDLANRVNRLTLETNRGSSSISEEIQNNSLKATLKELGIDKALNIDLDEEVTQEEFIEFLETMKKDLSK